MRFEVRGSRFEVLGSRFEVEVEVEDEKQIPPLRCGMTTKEQATAKASAPTKNRQRQKQVQQKKATTKAGGQLDQAVAS